MYGLLNAALKEFIASSYGPTTWTEVGEAVGIGALDFNKMEPYPDQLTQSMVETASKAASCSVADFLEGFGAFWVDYTAQNGYAPLFEIAGDSLRDFLLSLDALHARVGRSFPKLKPPSFRFDEVDATTVRMHYVSTRSGLCPMIPGLLRGLSVRFACSIGVHEVRCTQRGADHCEFEVSFPSTPA